MNKRTVKQALESWQRAGLDEIPQFNPAMEKALLQQESEQSSELTLQEIEMTAQQDPAAALAMLAEKVSKCTLCPQLAGTRTQTVFGTGNPQARLLFLGEAPGADEDAQGVPFVGRSGQLLTDMIEKGMKISREEIYICNILRCRPPENRNPSTEEANCCRPFLEAQINIVNPEFILCLGAVAAKNLLHVDIAIGKLRGIVHLWQGRKVICTYHPAYLLRNPPAKKDTWMDLQLLMREMGLQ